MPEHDRHELDATSLRGLAHPLRIRSLGSLRADGPNTATRLAELFGQRSGTTSWHLRQLAEHGFVEQDPQARQPTRTLVARRSAGNRTTSGEVRR